jgi:peptide/nickel transport system substrate-binding protein
LPEGASRVAIAAALGAGAGAHAKTRAADSDPGSMDPHSRNVASTLSHLSNIYEPLIRRAKALGVEPALALKWEATSPTTWRFTLRQGVKWQDGSPFTADDVVFTMAAPGPTRCWRRSCAAARKEDRRHCRFR